jgi:hypothetical protein
VRSFLALFFLLLVASSARAQTPLDWTDGTGGIQCSAAQPDWTGSPVLTCRVRIPAKSWSITTTCVPAEVKTFAVGIRSTLATDTAFAECEVNLLPGVYGASTPATPVSLPRHTAPAAPVLGN